MEVSVESALHAGDASNSERRWCLVFSITMLARQERREVVLRHKFTIEEPYLVSYAEWMSFVEAVDARCLKFGPHGIISIDHEVAEARYIMFTVGTGGSYLGSQGTFAFVSVPWGYDICSKLRAAIVDAAEKNWKFAA